MRQNKKNSLNLAHQLGVSEQEFLEPFQMFQSIRRKSIMEAINRLSDEEKKYAIWFMDRGNHLSELRLKYLFVPRWKRILKRFCNIKDRFYMCEEYSLETKKLKKELFGHLMETQYYNIESLLLRYKDELMIISGAHMKGWRTSKYWKNYHKQMMVSLKLWLKQQIDD